MTDKMFDNLMNFESNRKILDFKFKHDNILIWPFVRYGLFLEAINKKLNLTPESSSFERPGFKDGIDYLFKTILQSTLNVSKRFDIIIFGSSVGVVLLKENKWFGRINDYFALEYEDQTLVIDNSHRFKYKHPRYPKNVKYHDLIRIRAKLKNRFFGRVSPQDKREIDNLINLLKETFPYQVDETYYEKTRKRMLSLSSEIRYLKPHYKKLFLKIQPKIIFIEDGSYGNQSYILKWAEDLEIKTAEFQHGVISLSHPAYNYGPAIFESEEYKKYLPKYFLTYGQFWSDNIRTPSEKIVIGNPHFSSKLEEYEGKTRQHENTYKTILIVSDPPLSHDFIKFTTELSNKLKNKNFKIIYKLHPREAHLLNERYLPLKNLQNITLVTSGDIYDLIFNSDFIVGSVSTTLFEAMGFNKPIFVYNCIFSQVTVPQSIGIRFRTGHELFELIKNNLRIKPIKNIEYYWARNWKEKYKNFIENKILNISSKL
jgi:hypothetical protein